MEEVGRVMRDEELTVRALFLVFTNSRDLGEKTSLEGTGFQQLFELTNQGDPWIRLRTSLARGEPSQHRGSLRSQRRPLGME